MTSQFAYMTSLWNFSHVAVFLLSRFILVQVLCNTITGSRVRKIFLYKGLTKNPELRNTPVWVLSHIWRLVQVRDTKFSTKLNAAKYQGYSFYRFWVINIKPTKRMKLPLAPSPSPRLRQIVSSKLESSKC